MEGTVAADDYHLSGGRGIDREIYRYRVKKERKKDREREREQKKKQVIYG